jgi:ABC-type dipeptide/oligopeptide/nickel transport system permease subunit
VTPSRHGIIVLLSMLNPATRTTATRPTSLQWSYYLGPFVVLATLDMGSIILAISGLNFLGLGAQPPTPEWGAMLNDARPFLQSAPQLLLYPGVAIVLVVLGFNLLRDVLDPTAYRK